MNNHHSKFNSGNNGRTGYKTRQLISLEYGWTVQTLRNKLHQYKIDLPNGSITPKWQREIYTNLGYPPEVSKKDYEDV